MPHIYSVVPDKPQDVGVPIYDSESGGLNENHSGNPIVRRYIADEKAKTVWLSTGRRCEPARNPVFGKNRVSC
jgi:hypothetical protein